MQKLNPNIRKKWTQEEVNILKLQYGVQPINIIATILGRSVTSLSHKIHRLGLDDPRKWTPEEDSILKDNYQYYPDIWNLLPNRSRTAITQRARHLGLKRKCGNYRINHKFFEAWTHESAYTIGFFLADGCIEPKLNRLTISLAVKDSEHLMAIKTAMECENPLCYKRNRNEVSLYIHNAKLVKDIIDKGVLPKKTLIARLPSCPNRFMPDLIRGIFDGDGSCYKDGSTIRIQFLGTKALLAKIALVLHEQCNTRLAIPRKRKVNCFELKYGAKTDIEKIRKYLYPNNRSFIYLQRKMVPAREETPGKINSAQIRQANSSRIGEPEGKNNSSMPAETTRRAPIIG